MMPMSTTVSYLILYCIVFYLMLADGSIWGSIPVSAEERFLDRAGAAGLNEGFMVSLPGTE